MLSNTLTETWKWHLVHQVGMTPISAMPHRWQHHHFQIATNACCQLIATTINRSKATLKKLWEYHVVNYVLVHIINHINYILSKTPTSSTSDLVMLTSLMYCPWCWFVVSTSESPPTFPTTTVLPSLYVLSTTLLGVGEIGGDASCGQFLRVWALRAGDHGGYSLTVMCKIAKGFNPSSVKVLVRSTWAHMRGIWGHDEIVGHLGECCQSVVGLGIWWPWQLQPYSNAQDHQGLQSIQCEGIG